VVAADGRVVLVRRRNEPLRGRWSLPGGALEVGERLEQGVEREVFEETNLVVDVGPIVDVFDHVEMDDDGRVKYHYVLIDYRCDVRSGWLTAGTDVDAVALADPSALADYALTERAVAVIGRACASRRPS
jgi:8-oxo-dGTP diphosphatase